MARLPHPGGDSGTWGQVLNDFLGIVHKTDGSLKDGVIASTNLDSTVQTSLMLANTAIQAGDVDTVVSDAVSNVSSATHAAVVAAGPTWSTLLGKPAVIAEGATQLNARTAIGALGRDEMFVSVKSYGAVGDGSTDDSAAVMAAIAANPGKMIYFPSGTYIIASATRLPLDVNFTSLGGDGPALSKIKFTDAAGGIDIGDGTNNVYLNALRDLAIIGTTASTTTLIRCRKMYEPIWQNMSIEQAAVRLVHLDDCGQLDADWLRMSAAPVGIEFTGSTANIVNARLCNFYNLTVAISFRGASIGRFKMVDSWVEAVPVLVDINAPGQIVSVGEFIIQDVRILKAPLPESEPGVLPAVSATRNFTVLKTVAASSINANEIRVEGCYIFAPESTAPLVDLTAFSNNAGTIRCGLRNLNVDIKSTADPLIDVHASQSWWLVIAEVQGIRSSISAYPSGKWAKTPLAIGGVWLSPLRLDGVGAPEGVVAAPPGSTYQRADGGALSMYTKTSGIDATGWQSISLAGDIEAPTTVRSTDAIENDFGTNILQAQRSWAESTNPGAVVFGVNGAGQARASGAFGSFLADNASGNVIAYGSGSVEVLNGSNITLMPKLDSDRVQVGRGVLGLANYATPSRPAAVTSQGCMIFDADLGKPIWSDGSVWKDFTGATV